MIPYTDNEDLISSLERAAHFCSGTQPTHTLLRFHNGRRSRPPSMCSASSPFFASFFVHELTYNKTTKLIDIMITKQE